MMKQAKSAIIRIVISACALGLVFYAARGKLLDAFSYFTNLDYLPFLTAVAILFGSLFVVSQRLHLILSVQGVIVSRLRLYYLWLISLFFNLFLPSAIGGDIAKAYYIYKDSGRKAAAVSSVVVDRFLGLMATVSMATVGFFLVRAQIRHPHIGVILLCFLTIVIVGTLFVVSSRFSTPLKIMILRFMPRQLRQGLERFFEALGHYRDSRQDFLVGYGYSVIAQSLFIIIFYFLARSLRIQLPLSLFFLLIPLVTLCSMIPSIGGLGVREAAMVYLFQSYLPVPQAIAFSLLGALFIYGIGGACGILYAVRGGAVIRDVEQIEASVEGGP